MSQASFTTFAVVLLRKLIAEGRVELERRTFLKDEEIVTESLLHDRRQGVLRLDRGLDHFKDPGLVVDDDAAGLQRRVAKLRDFPIAPLRIEVARRHNRKEEGRLGELIQDFLAEDVVPRQLLVSPDFGFLAQSHAEHGLQRFVETGDPARVLGLQGLVVKMGVADEEMLFEAAFRLAREHPASPPIPPLPDCHAPSGTNLIEPLPICRRKRFQKQCSLRHL
jgi:hypothetical protein